MMPVEAKPLEHVDVFFHLDRCHLPGVHGSYPAGFKAEGRCAGDEGNHHWKLGRYLVQHTLLMRVSAS